MKYSPEQIMETLKSIVAVELDPMDNTLDVVMTDVVGADSHITIPEHFSGVEFEEGTFTRNLLSLIEAHLTGESNIEICSRPIGF